jgi:transposase
MSSIIRQKVGDKIYLYESVSYRNSDGKPRNKRVPIGKLDTVTGNPVYKPEYIERMAYKGTPVDIPETKLSFSVEDIRNSSIKEYGAYYLYSHIAKSTELSEVLEKAMPKYWKELFALACYLVSSGDPFQYCESWIQSTETPDVGSLSSQRISESLTAVTAEDREDFYRAWCRLRSEKEYLALDITSSSSYSSLIEDVEWGYNRDGEQLPQINICMLMGEQSKLPIYQTIYSGSLKDVKTLETTLESFRAIAGDQTILVVMDKGFFSTRNINAMLGEEHKTRFIISVPFTCGFAKKQVDSERKDIDTIQNTMVIGGDSIRGIMKRRSWNAGCEVYTHVYFNALKAMKIRESLYAYVSLLKEKAESDPEKAYGQDEYIKYLSIRKSEKSASGYLVSIRENVVDSELETAGWMVLISNDVSNVKEAVSIYREKDVVEKGFFRLKNCLDLGRLRVHRSDCMQNKVFVGFIALILMSHIHKVMMEKELYKSMTMKKMIMTLSKLRVQQIKGKRILFPATKEQNDIFKAFGISVLL